MDPAAPAAYLLARAKVVSAFVESRIVLASRYRLDKLLGSGAMGDVWHARDLRLDREVAVKVMHAGARPDLTARSRFQKEAKVAARLRHPGITLVYDVDEHLGRDAYAGRLFIVTELLRGEDLEHYLGAHPGPLPVPQVIDYGLQLADALACAHENGIVHRDLKPSNIFVHDRDRLKVCDFGIAWQMSDQSRLTQTGWTVGTPAYMAPEQWEGSPATASMDLYALGCVLYRMLAGRLPFDGLSPPVLMRQHFSRRPVPPSDHNPRVPAALDDLVLALLAKHRSDRPADARVVHAALARIATAIRDASGRPGPAPWGAPSVTPGQGQDAPTLPPVGQPPAAVVPAARRTALIACASPGQESFDVLAVDRAGHVQGRTDFADGGGLYQRSGRWVPWFTAAELPGRVSALALGMSNDGHWAAVAVADGEPYLKLDVQEPHRLCGPGTASAVGLPVRDVAVSYAPAQPEVFALDSAGSVWHLTWPAGTWALWDDSLAGQAAPDPAAAIAMACGASGRQALAAIAGTRLLMKCRTPRGDWSGWGSTDLRRRLTSTACAVSERYLAAFALDESGAIWAGMHSPGRSGPAEPAALAPWGVVPSPGGVAGIAATALDAQRGAADGNGLLVAMTSDGAIHSARYKLGAGSELQWSAWRQMPALE